jgi:hypothetical protein
VHCGHSYRPDYRSKMKQNKNNNSSAIYY